MKNILDLKTLAVGIVCVLAAGFSHAQFPPAGAAEEIEGRLPQ